MQHQLRTVAQSKPLVRLMPWLLAVLQLVCGVSCARQGKTDLPHVLTMLLPRDVQQLDPRYVSDAYGLKVSRLLFASLMRIDPETLETVPDLAQSLKLVGDTEYIVQLRPGLHFSDGSVLDAEDVLAT